MLFHSLNVWWVFGLVPWYGVIKFLYHVSLLDIFQHIKINGYLIFKYPVKVWTKYRSILCIHSSQLSIGSIHPHDGGWDNMDNVFSIKNTWTLFHTCLGLNCMECIFMLGVHTMLFLQVRWHHTHPVENHLVIALPLRSLCCQYLGFNNQREVRLLP